MHTVKVRTECTARMRSFTSLNAPQIVYYPEVRTEFADSFATTEDTLRFIKDGGEGRRVGTLAVYVDNMEQAKLSVPLALSNVFPGLSRGDVFAVRCPFNYLTSEMPELCDSLNACANPCATHRALLRPLAKNGRNSMFSAGTSVRRYVPCNRSPKWVAGLSDETPPYKGLFSSVFYLCPCLARLSLFLHVPRRSITSYCFTPQVGCPQTASGAQFDATLADYYTSSLLL